MARAVAESHDIGANLQPPPGFVGSTEDFKKRQQAAEEVYLWPENERAWGCWTAVQTQWRVGMAGATGLDYAGVRALLDEEGLEGDERRDVFTGIRAAEAATLAARHEQHERERKARDQQQERGRP